MRNTLTALALALVTSGTQALVSFPGSSESGVTPVDNEFAAGIPILYGREVVLDAEANVTFTAVFSEARYLNAFITIGHTTFSNAIDTGDSYTSQFGDGLLPFSFSVLDTGLVSTNGSNQEAWEAQNASPYFFVTPAVIDGAVESFYIGLNDDGGAIDDDYDDYVIRVDVEPVAVPEPMPAMLLGLGLIGIGLTRLRGGSRKAAPSQAAPAEPRRSAAT